MRIVKCISEGKIRTLHKTFLTSQFVTDHSSGCANVDV